MIFEELRTKLYGEALNLESSQDITDKFKREMLILVEKCALELMEKEESFFGLFLIQMKREVNLDIAAPLATIPLNEGYLLYINPLTFLPSTKEEMKALLKHEVYHIMYSHPQRIRALKNKYSLLAINTAMDISVNQYIKNLPSWSKKLENVSLEYNVHLEENMLLEKYVQIIQKAIDELTLKKDKKSSEEAVDMERVHEVWLNNENITLDSINALQKKASSNAYKGIVPQGMEEPLKILQEKSEITWQEYLKNTAATMKCGYRKTITRRDRRQPNRLDIRGVLPKRIPKILVALDISASMTDKELHNILIEVFNITKNYEAEITVIECDEVIRRIYGIKNIKDIKNPLETKGATAFSPVFQYIKEKNLKDYFLIYFTDGKGEEKLRVKPINFKTLWVITNRTEDLSLREYPGKILNMNKESRKDDKDYGIKVAKELLKDWDIDTEANSIQSLRVDV